MPSIKINLDGETYDRLIQEAGAERRPIDWQAEVMIRRSLGLQVPYPKCDVMQTAPVQSQ